MKKLILFTLMLFTLSACEKLKFWEDTNSQAAEMHTYTCPMHPEIISDKPGKCPKCGMDLVLKDAPAQKEDGIKLDDLLQPTNNYVVSQLPVTRLAKENVPTTVEALGIVDYDTRQIGTISSRIAGRIEKLYVRYKFQKVSKGQRILDIYSPELLTAQQNHLFVLKNDRSNAMMINASRQKLLLLGMPASQIQSISRKGKPDLSVPVFSNYSGYIQSAGGMENQSQPNEVMQANSVTAELPLKEGMYLQKGENIFTVYNPSRSWALLNIFAEDIALVSKGQSVTVIPQNDPSSRFKGTIDFIEPFFRPDSKTVTARVYFDNSVAKIPIGTQVNAEISSHSKSADWLPKTAVVSLGIDKIVFKKAPGGFTAHKVGTGAIVKDKIEIVSGLKPEDEVAENAQYLMDSESLIKVNK
ncbi:MULTISPECIES: efflux RND transporter periplasmic adaptor subunit [unclassified Kaistella]|uniref:efflux RND transporter periplasmic adaptor subunit n=1 Tax=unclassified Kaistella TaxID=2762626 RepID=UPI002735650A|nr:MULTISPECIES: efflux RND transporter periplasmic adaptor subunit [unclassified Kaistella]MDP2454459.1 efflux RND transporter periplasmic adaptor subunit [Kaistella sp. SH11-4b]MDP2457197.1 efflux RND transporter periplasmic adaptor subunit [Kaistella sp. SH40-3]MDP2459957.1 efflux RND transporter periplasmic adaptor subunit [Kaistella sp. SH19-2b]